MRAAQGSRVVTRVRAEVMCADCVVENVRYRFRGALRAGRGGSGRGCELTRGDRVLFMYTGDAAST